MCSLDSITRSQDAIRQLFRVRRDLSGNLAPLSGVFPTRWPRSSAEPRWRACADHDALGASRRPRTSRRQSSAMVPATQAVQHDADFLLGRVLPPGRATDLFRDLVRRFLHRLGFLSHLRSLYGSDEPETLSSSTRQICLTGADAGHAPKLKLITDLARL